MGATIYWMDLETQDEKQALHNLFDHIKILSLLRILSKIEYFRDLINASEDIQEIIKNGRMKTSEFKSRILDFFTKIDIKSAIPHLKQYLETIPNYKSKTLIEILEILENKYVSVSLQDMDGFFGGEEDNELIIKSDLLTLDDLNYQGNFLSAYSVRLTSFRIVGTYDIEDQLDGASDEGDTIFIGRFYPEDEPDEDSGDFTLLAFGLFKD